MVAGSFPKVELLGRGVNYPPLLAQRLTNE